MKTHTLLAVVFAAGLLLSCSSIKVKSDYNEAADFSTYTTFDFSESSTSLPVNELVKKRILSSITDNLTQKGLTRSSTPDILVDLGLVTKDKKEYTTNTVGVNSYYGRRWRIGTGVSSSRTEVREYTEGTLLIHLVDAKKEELLWMGSGSGTLNDKSSRPEQITKAVDKIMASYPPK